MTPPSAADPRPLSPDRQSVTPMRQLTYADALSECLLQSMRLDPDIVLFGESIGDGDGVYGVEAAAERYFKKPARDLTSSEAALVAAVLPNPRYFSLQKPSAYTRFRQTMIQRRMPIAAQTFGP